MYLRHAGKYLIQWISYLPGLEASRFLPGFYRFNRRGFLPNLWAKMEVFYRFFTECAAMVTVHYALVARLRDGCWFTSCLGWHVCWMRDKAYAAVEGVYNPALSKAYSYNVTQDR